MSTKTSERAATETADSRKPMNRFAMRQRYSPSSRTVVVTAIGVVVGFLFVFPAMWLLIDSFRPNSDIETSMSASGWAVFIPHRVTLGNYLTVLIQDNFGTALLNSLIVCAVSVAVGLVISAMAAYALAAFDFRGREFIFGLIVISFMIPFEALAVPLAQQFTSLGLGNTYTGLILPGIGNGLAVFNLRQYFLGIPQFYREAAKMDGASEGRILFQLYLPMSKPAMISSGLLIFIAQWSSFLWPLLIVSEKSLQVAPVALANTFGQFGSDYGANFAGSVLLTLIPAIVILVLQRMFGGISFSSGGK